MILFCSFCSSVDNNEDLEAIKILVEPNYHGTAIATAVIKVHFTLFSPMNPNYEKLEVNAVESISINFSMSLAIKNSADTLQIQAVGYNYNEQPISCGLSEKFPWLAIKKTPTAKIPLEACSPSPCERTSSCMIAIDL